MARGSAASTGPAPATPLAPPPAPAAAPAAAPVAAVRFAALSWEVSGGASSASRREAGAAAAAAAAAAAEGGVEAAHLSGGSSASSDLDPSGEEDSDDEEPGEDEERPAMGRRVSWLWPQKTGELPDYVQAQFRVKTFGLLSGQFAVIFVLIVGMQLGLEWFGARSVEARAAGQVSPADHPMAPVAGAVHQNSIHASQDRASWMVVIVVLSLVILIMLKLLYSYRSTYPTNYCLLAAVTVMGGVFWGWSGAPSRMRSGGHFHLQLVGIVGVAALVATVLCRLLPRCLEDGRTQVWAVVAAGWSVGAALDVFLVVFLLGIPARWAGLAVAVTGLQFVVLLCATGRLLVRCNPDDFLKVIVLMDAAVLIVTTFPIFLAVLPCVLSDQAEGEDRMQQRH